MEHKYPLTVGMVNEIPDMETSELKKMQEELLFDCIEQTEVGARIDQTLLSAMCMAQGELLTRKAIEVEQLQSRVDEMERKLKYLYDGLLISDMYHGL